MAATQKTIPITDQPYLCRESLRAQQLWEQCKLQMHPHTRLSLWYIARILLISAGTLAAGYWAMGYHWGWCLQPLVLVLLCRSLVALGKHMHDASHRNMSHNSARQPWVKALARRLRLSHHHVVNDVLMHGLLAPLLWYDAALYSKEHQSHHAWLGTPGKDLELPTIAAQAKKTLWQAMQPFIFSWGWWRSAAIGHLTVMPLRRLLFTVSWWACLLLALWALAGHLFVVYVLATVLLTRIGPYHVVRVFLELCDHYNMPKAGVLEYTRNMPNNWLGWFLYPDHDNYHIAHHLYPKVPQPRLKKVHLLLMQVPEYRQAAHFKTYFTGPQAVAKSITGQH